MKVLKKSLGRTCIRFLFCLVVIGVLGGAAEAALAGSNTAPPTVRARMSGQDEGSNSGAPSVPVVPSVSTSQEYVLGTGDRLRLTVYGEDDLSGEYEVSSTGIVSLPLIGNVQAASQTIRDFQEAVRNKLAAGYLHDPRVSVQVANYRPFFILGEVSKPGSYAYVNGMTVLNAVAMAGGYTYRADSSGVIIVHANDPEKKEKHVREEETVKPGDIVRVPERFF